MIDRNLINLCIKAARAAGKQILEIYSSNFTATKKEDGSPVTQADLLSNEILYEHLQSLHIPIISEESPRIGEPDRTFWLIDPLDGTKDFVAKNDEFTINIALVENNRPVFGLIYAPALNELFWAHTNEVWSSVQDQEFERVIVQPGRSNLVCLSSRFHPDPLDKEFQLRMGISECVPVGSAVKFMRLCEGKADVYYRTAPTSEWDTAAGQMLIEAQGGQLIDLTTQQPLQYGKTNFRNSSFFAFRSPYSFELFKEGVQ